MKNKTPNHGDFAEESLRRHLDDAVTDFDRHPLLTQIRNASISLRDFGFVMKSRLDAATNFVPFLRAAEEKLRASADWKDVADTMRGNLHEELGIVHDEEKPDASHETWRASFRGGLERMLRAERIELSELPTDATIAEIAAEYGARLLSMPQHHAPEFLAGAFMTLEGILEKEFSAIREHLRLRCKGLMTPNEMLYVDHHAGHEHRHCEEIAEPLIKRCIESPSLVPEVIEGIRTMSKLRCNGVLTAIERHLGK